MRWPIVRLIAARETRDLLRDRRTVMLILVMPAVLYPFFGAAIALFAYSAAGQKTVVGVAGGEHLAQPPEPRPGLPPRPEFPPLVEGDQFAEPEPAADAPATDTEAAAAQIGRLSVVLVGGDGTDALKSKAVDAVVVLPAGVLDRAKGGDKPVVRILDRDGDEKSKLAARRATAAVRRWEAKVREVRLLREGLPKDFDQPFAVEDPQSKKKTKKKVADELRDQFVKIFPFLLMMWLLAGAIQPAVDLTAGEKERGTMETLLISPAERAEIVVGKFLATTLFAFASVVWNVVWIAGGGVVAEFVFGEPVIYLQGLIGCVVLGLPMAMLFSAVCLTLGVFARSTKEGQYYLMPLLLVTMPLAFWSMKPGAELTTGNALVPVTGAMLLQQKLLAVTDDPVPWAMFAPVLGGLTACVAAALGLAIWQFKRESVLFRETGSEKGAGFLARLRGKG